MPVRTRPFEISFCPLIRTSNPFSAFGEGGGKRRKRKKKEEKKKKTSKKKKKKKKKTKKKLTIKPRHLRMKGLEEEIESRFRLPEPESTDPVQLGLKPNIWGEVEDLPEDGPHLEVGGLVGGNPIGVETKDDIPGLVMQKTPRAEQVLVGLPILNVLQYAFGVFPGPPVFKPFGKLRI